MRGARGSFLMAPLLANLRHGKSTTNLACKNVRNLSGGEQLQPDRCWDCTIASGTRPRASGSSHKAASAEAAIPASLHGHVLPDSVRRDSAQSVLTPVFQNQPNRRTQAGSALFQIPALTIGARHFRRPGNKPVAIPLDDCRKFVPHEKSIRLIYSFRFIARTR